MTTETEVRNKQTEVWNMKAAGWKKWDRFIMQFLKPVADEILDQVNLSDGDLVLDVATGSGEPGLTAARRVGSGRVIGLDISREMISLANAKAASLGIRNYEARLYSTREFPFDSDTFDAVISRFGVMFFPDVLGGLKEMVRVAKPGKGVSVSVWGPQNESLKSALQILNRELRLPEIRPDSPGPFRCSEPGKIVSLLRQAGLRKVEQADVKVHRVHESFEEYWENQLDTDHNIASEFNGLDPERKKSVKSLVSSAVGTAKGADRHLEFESVAWVGHGIK